MAFKVMPRVAQYMQVSRDTAASFGQVVTVSGRVLPLPVDSETGYLKSYVATNYAVQGSGYDLMAEAISALHRAGLGDQILMPIHDELVTSADPEVTAAVSEAMLRIPAPLVEHLHGIPFQLFAEPELTGDHWAKPDESEDVALYELPDADDDEEDGN
jgi:DNA polymerase-1